MLSKKIKEQISTLDSDVVAAYLKKCGWRKGNHKAKDNCFSLWYKEFSTDECGRINVHKRVDEIELMLPHHKHYSDYGRVMLYLFECLSIVNDKCECEILKDILSNK